MIDSIPNYGYYYSICEGTILYRKDCGVEACGSASCCKSQASDNFIFFLPKEYEYQNSQKEKIPFYSVSQISNERYHCKGNENCIYKIRPIDCRSYPLFPAVHKYKLVGYFDCRKSHNCPLSLNIELRDHLQQINKWWPILLKHEIILNYVIIIGKTYLKDMPVVPL